jgi:anaerobic magnesium-protoporphyrin IX monomethyl ester cyclase
MKPSIDKNIVLVNPPLALEGDSLDALGLEILQTGLRDVGYNNVSILHGDIDGIRTVDEMIDRIHLLVGENLDFLGIGILPAVVGFSRELMEKIRSSFSNRALEICVGGYFPTSMEEKVFKVFNDSPPDYSVLGPGEQALPEILAHGKNKLIPNVLTLKDGEILNGGRSMLDFSDRPWPSREKTLNGNTKLAKIVRLVGCPGNCTFCTIHTYAQDSFQNVPKQRDPVDFVAEMKFLHEKHGIIGFDIVDDEAIGDNPEDWELICREIEKNGLKGKVNFSIMARCESIADNPDIIKMMAEHGLKFCFCGMESVTERQLKLYKKLRSRTSNVDYQQYLEQIKASKIILEANGILPHFGYIPVDAEVTLEELEKSTNLIKELGILYYTTDLFKRLAIYKGSAIETLYRKRDLLLRIENPKDEEWYMQRHNYKYTDPRIEHFKSVYG